MTDRCELRPFLKPLVIFYLLLGAVDTIHHLHAALFLGQSNALHAVWLNVVLVPMAILFLFLYLFYQVKFLLWLFYSICGLAIVVPGIYHGGWHHLAKILIAFRMEGESNDITSLFPSGEYHYWFYEVTGLLEFCLALVAALFLYKSLVTRTGQRR